MRRYKESRWTAAHTFLFIVWLTMSGLAVFSYTPNTKLEIIVPWIIMTIIFAEGLLYRFWTRR